MGERPKKWRFGLKAKFGIIFAIFFLLAGGILGTSVYYILSLRGDAQAINYAGSERMRSFKLAFLLNQYAEEGQESVKGLLRNETQEELERWERIAYGLRDGDKGLGLVKVKPRYNKNVHNLYESLTRHIEDFQSRFRPQALGVLNGTSAEEVQGALAEVNRFVPLFVHDIDRTVNLFERESRGKLSQFLTLEFVLIGMVVSFAGFSTFFVVWAVLRPMKKIEQGAERLSHGRWEERILLHTGDELEKLANVFNGMADELAKKYRQLRTQNEQLTALNKLIGEAAIKDSLTGFYNYYYFQEVLNIEFQSARRYAQPLSLLLIDMDHFKTVNDLWGHPFGDFVLKEFAELIRKHLRASDIACRIGGEEVAILLPGTGPEGALETGEKLRKAVTNHAFSKDEKSCRVSVTVGIASFGDIAINSEADLLRYADEALLEGKQRGRNTIVYWAEIYEDKMVTKGMERQGLAVYREKFLAAERNLKRSYMETVQAFLKALEAKDNYSMKHCYIVADYSVKLASALGLPGEEIEIIKNAALLHDIGKLGIPDHILMKVGPLAEEERDILREHSYMSLSILERVRFLEKEIPIIYHHHERWDGSGYPKRLRGNEIPLGARILAVADTYEALTSDRPYRKGCTPEEAFEELRKGVASQFDPELVTVFIKTMQGTLKREA